MYLREKFVPNTHFFDKNKSWNLLFLGSFLMVDIPNGIQPFGLIFVCFPFSLRVQEKITWRSLIVPVEFLFFVSIDKIFKL